VPDEANGFLLLQFGEEDIFWPDEEAAAEMVGKAADDGEDWDEELAEDYVAPPVEERLTYSLETFDTELARKVVARNAAVLRRVDDSLARPEFQVEEPYDLRVDVFMQWNRLARLISCRSRIQVEAGNDGAALDDALCLLRLGKKVQAAKGPLMVYLMGSMFHDHGANLLAYLAPRLHSGPETLKAFISRSADLYPDPADLADALRTEYVFFVRASAASDFVDGLEGNFLERTLWRFTFKPNRMRRLLADETRLLMAAVAKPATQRDLPDPETYGSSFRRVVSSAGLDDGTMALAEALPNYRQGLRRQDEACLRLSAARVLLALRCWHTVHQGLPDQLDALVPEYLERVPLDPFDGQPLRYSREKRLLFSAASPNQEFPIEFEP
jgi:hypothetical protein